MKRSYWPYNVPWKQREGVEVLLYSSFNLDASGMWVINVSPLPRYPREWPGTHYVGRWVGPRAGHLVHIDGKYHVSSMIRICLMLTASQSLLNLWTISNVTVVKLFHFRIPFPCVCLYVCVCVCACVCMRVCTCMYVCVCVSIIT